MVQNPNVSVVLVIDGDQFLGYRRAGDAALSLPGGKIERGETSAEAAIREAREETGLTVELISDFPYIGRSHLGSGGVVVAAWLARVTGGELHAEPTREGEPVWASIAEIGEGPYGRYNRRAAEFHGIIPWKLD